MATSIFTNDEEIQRLNSQYISGYTALYELFLGNVERYKPTEGSTITKNIKLNELNLGLTKKENTEINKTIAIETDDTFKRMFFTTELQESDYQEEGIDIVDPKIRDKLKQEYDFRFINGDNYGNKGLFQNEKSNNYNIMESEIQPKTPDASIDLIKRMLKISLDSGNSIKQIIPFGSFITTLDKNISGTNLTYKKYILENIDNKTSINFIDPTFIKGIPTTGKSGLLMVDLNTTFVQMIREPNLHKIWEDKVGKSYIYESSTIACSPRAENSIVRINFTEE